MPSGITPAAENLHTNIVTVQKGAMPSGITPAAENLHTNIVHLTRKPASISHSLPRKVAHLAGDDRHAVAAPDKLAGELMMTGSARLVNCGKGLMDQ
jgi:hypothetical protein